LCRMVQTKSNRAKKAWCRGRKMLGGSEPTACTSKKGQPKKKVKNAFQRKKEHLTNLRDKGPGCPFLQRNLVTSKGQ